MFTQCPSCETVFRITAEQLRMREGLVRCGDCAEVFNASWHLIDDVDVPTLRRDSPVPRGARPESGEADSGEPSGGPTRVEPETLDDGLEPGPGFGGNGRLFDLDGELARELDIDESALDQLTPEDIRAALEDDEVAGGAGQPAPERRREPPRLPPAGGRQGATRRRTAAGDPAPRRTAGETRGPRLRAEPRLSPPATAVDEPEEDEPEAVEPADAMDDEETDLAFTPVPLSVPRAEPPPRHEVAPDSGPVKRSRSTRGSESGGSGRRSGNAAERRHENDIRPPIMPMQKPEYARLRVGGAGWERSRRRPQSAGGLFALVGSLLLIILLGVQVRFVLLDELASIPAVRPWLSLFCALAACEVPGRDEPARIELAQTRVDLHPEIPGALRVRIHVVNRGNLPQPYPSIQLTLTDRDGRVVGRRTYRASDYLDGDEADTRLAPGIMSVVTLNLAHPDDNAVGFQADVVSG